MRIIFINFFSEGFQGPAPRQYSVKYHEQFIAAARVIAEIICLVKYSNVELWEVVDFLFRV